MAALILALTALWHALAAWHFTVTPHRTLARTTAERPVSPLTAELFRFLGGMNVAAVVLAVAAVLQADIRTVAALTLAVANGSQLLQDLRVRRLGLARGPFFLQILVGDAVFTAANLAVVVV